MRRRSEIGSIASGMIHSFVSRNNDLGGYWGIGVLYLYALQAGSLCLTIDLLRSSVNSSAGRWLPAHLRSDCEALISQYKVMLYALLDKRKVPEAWVSGAVFNIEFESLTAAPAYPRIGENSEAFACSLSIRDDLGRERIFRVDGWCWPHCPLRATKRG